MNAENEIVHSQTPTDVPTKIIKQIFLIPGKVISMSILLNQKSTFCKQSGLSGKALMEKLLEEIPKLSLGEVETYNISKNRTEVQTPSIQDIKYIENNTWVRGNTRFTSSVEHDITFNTRNKSGISKHPCIFLFII